MLCPVCDRTRVKGEFGEQHETRCDGLVADCAQQFLGAGEVTAVFGRDDSRRLLRREERRPGAGLGHGARMIGLPTARGASNRRVTSDQLTRFHSRST